MITKQLHVNTFYLFQWRCLWIGWLLLLSFQLNAQQKFTAGQLKKMSVEQLMNLEVVLVSGSPQRLIEVASAIQVVTNEDIIRSPVLRLPEAVRLASNIQAAQSNSHDWAITARGFNAAQLGNSALANKLLVMIDGRTVYTPLFAGVFWDVQNVLLNDVDRIEVVSGPGGTIWGANAVNGVINVITKDSRETQGLYASVAAGSYLDNLVNVRYGGRIDSNFTFRVQGQHFGFKNSYNVNGSEVNDSWQFTQGGFRADYQSSSKSKLSLQGSLYGAEEGDPLLVKANGGYLLGKWTYVFSDRADLRVQAYFDKTHREIRDIAYTTQLETYDLDIQHRFRPTPRHELLWGIAHRFMRDENKQNRFVIFDPANKDFSQFSAFVQDKIGILPEKLDLYLGAKLLHNVYTNFEVQPSVRLAWTPRPNETIWAAVSRAVRTPSRYDVEATPGYFNADFKSESVIAYELGYRIRPVEQISFSLAGFYNTYKNLRSVDYNLSPPPQLVFGDNQSAETAGIEFSGNFYIASSWRLRGGFTYLWKDIKAAAPIVVPGSDLFEAVDPKVQALLQSILDLPNNFQLDFIGRYVDRLQAVPGLSPAIPAYFEVNARFSWVYKWITASVAAQNLVQNRHAEFGTTQLPRNIYFQLNLRL